MPYCHQCSRQVVDYSYLENDLCKICKKLNGTTAVCNVCGFTTCKCGTAHVPSTIIVANPILPSRNTTTIWTPPPIIYAPPPPVLPLPTFFDPFFGLLDRPIQNPGPMIRTGKTKGGHVAGEGEYFYNPQDSHIYKRY